MKLIIFDLDGTLVDSARDIASSVNELLVTMGRSPLGDETIYGFIGNGVRRLLELALTGASVEEIGKAEEIYLPIYRRRLLEHTRPYPGVVPALEALRRGRTLAVLSNKPARESRMILKGLGLDRYFQHVYGGDSFARKKPDPMGVVHLLSETRADAGETLLVGDSSVDLETARNASVRFCLVSYGIAGDGEIESLPDYRVDDLRELVPLVRA